MSGVGTPVERVARRFAGGSESPHNPLLKPRDKERERDSGRQADMKTKNYTHRQTDRGTSRGEGPMRASGFEPRPAAKRLARAHQPDLYLEPKWLRCLPDPVSTYPLHFIAPCRGELHRRFAGGSEYSCNSLLREREREADKQT